MTRFIDIFTDKTKEGCKIPKEDYLPNGIYPIIDQGKGMIAGYTNQKEGLFVDVPAIIFGDHTRIIKYIDFPFFLGADGVKLLKRKSNVEADDKYLYYYMKSKHIPNTGYNRHFKWLKETDYKLVSLNDQKHIVNVLSLLEHLMALKNKQLLKLDELVKSRFIEMFGDPLNNSRNWPTDILKSICTKIGSGATPRGGQSSYIEYGVSLIRSMNVHNGYFKYDDLAHINDEQAKQLNIVIVTENDVLFNITGASVTRSCIVPNDVLPARVNQHVAIIRPNLNKVDSIFLNCVFLNDSYQHFLLSMAESNGATRQAITKQQLERLVIPIPPSELQNKFTNFIKRIDKSKVKIQNSLDKLETLKKSLMQEYFA